MVLHACILTYCRFFLLFGRGPWAILGPNKKFKVLCRFIDINSYSRYSCEIQCSVCNMTIKLSC